MTARPTWPWRCSRTTLPPTSYGTFCESNPRQDHDAIADLARLCGYLPLALCVAAQRTRTRAAAGPRDQSGSTVRRSSVEVVSWALHDTVAGLSDPRGRLDFLDVDDDESSAVRRVLWWSYRALPAASRHLLRLLSLADGPHIDPTAAAALALPRVRNVRPRPTAPRPGSSTGVAANR